MRTHKAPTLTKLANDLGIKDSKVWYTKEDGWWLETEYEEKFLGSDSIGAYKAIKSIKSYKCKSWRITFFSASMKQRFTYGQMCFFSEVSANEELIRILRSYDKNKTSNEDYKVESYIANRLINPINPFTDDE